MDVKLDPSWKEVLKDEFTKSYFVNLTKKLKEAYRKETVFPPGKYIFRAFDSCPFDQVKVIILGQDPYHNFGQAEGLSFSVPDGVAIPPSLKNILQEINTDTGRPSQIKNGNLLPWVSQGVLLLNSVLTVVEGQPASHQGWGWEIFTDEALKVLAEKKEYLVFMLWGAYARKKKYLIPLEKHLVLEAPHPSPLSVNRGFWGCKHFSQANEYLLAHNLAPIKW